ncbi:hypothetical protein [Pollutibacter soli]|uniref:hypothetical protein n=1 Tax=Pollutibacter soli TaxID=3034157 RepID=UPI003014118D
MKVEMKRSLLIVSMAGLWLPALCQNKVTDSLGVLLSSVKADTTRLELLAELGLQYRNSNPDSAIFYGNEALALAREIQFKRGEVLSLANIAIASRERGDLPEALSMVMQASQMAEAGNCNIEKSLCLRRTGLLYMDLKDYTGLGLSLAYDIVKAHGGEIKVESMKSKGSSFIILIPNLMA